MTPRPVFYDRALARMSMPPHLRYTVNRCNWSAIGGPQESTITVYGPEEEIWELIEMLRCGVEIDAETGTIWWGYIEEVMIRTGALEIGASLVGMANRIAVAYSYVAPGTSTVGQRRTTPWAVDTISSGEYGTIDFLSSQGGLSDAAAVGRRDAILAARKFPQVVNGASGGDDDFGGPRGRVRYSGSKDALSATIKCRGWFRTLGWRMAAVAATTATDTTAQITSLVGTYGQFFQGVDVEAASGVTLSQYRTGETTAQQEVESLLGIGGASARRLLAKVSQERYLSVYEEPVHTDVRHFLDRYGQMWDEKDPVIESAPPVGVWCQLRDVIPGTADLSKLSDPSIQFIEGAVWQAGKGNGKARYSFRGQPSIEDMFKVQR